MKSFWSKYLSCDYEPDFTPIPDFRNVGSFNDCMGHFSSERHHHSQPLRPNPPFFHPLVATVNRTKAICHWIRGILRIWEAFNQMDIMSSSPIYYTLIRDRSINRVQDHADATIQANMVYPSNSPILPKNCYQPVPAVLWKRSGDI